MLKYIFSASRLFTFHHTKDKVNGVYLCHLPDVLGGCWVYNSKVYVYSIHFSLQENKLPLKCIMVWAFKMRLNNLDIVIIKFNWSFYPCFFFFSFSYKFYFQKVSLTYFIFNFLKKHKIFIFYHCTDMVRKITIDIQLFIFK